jgi:dynein heavy chain
MNPKSITINELYGYSDPKSQEWTEGILSNNFKICSKRNKTREWVILDGPVEAEWIENMNTVLDDNKCLCLMSSDKIPMSKYMTMVFETENLAKASPATVSRCGMIYLPADLVGNRNYYSKWLQEKYDKVFDQELQMHMFDLFDVLYRPSVKFVESNKKQYQIISDMSLTPGLYIYARYSTYRGWIC